MSKKGHSDEEILRAWREVEAGEMGAAAVPSVIAATVRERERGAAKLPA